MVSATYSDSTTETVTTGWTTSGFNSETAGSKTVTVTYQGKTATFTVTVVAVGPGQEGFSLSFAQITDAAPTINSPITIHINGNPKTANITVTDPGQYDGNSIKWYYGGSQITGAAITGGSGENLTVNSATYNKVGDHYVTVEVKKAGMFYSKTVKFTVAS